MAGVGQYAAEMLLAEGSCHLVVTHKSILRALLCVALGLPTVAFRAIDIHNGGICVFRSAFLAREFVFVHLAKGFFCPWGGAENPFKEALPVLHGWTSSGSQCREV